MHLVKKKNTSSNTTTNSMNTNEETNLFTSLHRKPEETKEKNKEKENKGFVHKQEFIKMLEPGDIDMLGTGVIIGISSVWLEVGALFAHMAGSPIATDLAIGGLVGMVVGFTIAAIGTLLD